jgi:hypothetical protein
MSTKRSSDAEEPAGKRLDTSERQPLPSGNPRRLAAMLRRDPTSRLSWLAPDMFAVELLPRLGDNRLHVPQHTVDAMPTTLQIVVNTPSDLRLGDRIKHMSAAVQQMVAAMPHCPTFKMTRGYHHEPLGEWPPGQLLLEDRHGTGSAVRLMNTEGVTVHELLSTADTTSICKVLGCDNKLYTLQHRSWERTATFTRWIVGNARLVEERSWGLLLCCPHQTSHNHDACALAQRADGKFVLLSRCISKDGSDKHVNFGLITVDEAAPSLVVHHLCIVQLPGAKDLTLMHGRLCLDADNNVVAVLGMYIADDNDYAIPFGHDHLMVLYMRDGVVQKWPIGPSDLRRLIAGSELQLPPLGGDALHVVGHNTIKVGDKFLLSCSAVQ